MDTAGRISQLTSQHVQIAEEKGMDLESLGAMMLIRFVLDTLLLARSMQCSLWWRLLLAPARSGEPGLISWVQGFLDLPTRPGV